MVRFYFVIFLLVSSVVHSQTITQQKIRENESPRYKEIFYVLKSDSSQKHGSYQRIGYNNELLLTGNYKNGKKDSLWTEYLRFSKIVINKGYYHNDQKVGVWEYYNNDGTLALKYDYNSNIKVYSEKEIQGNVNETFIKNDTGFVSVRLQREAFFNGDEEQLWKFIKSSIKAPILSNEKDTKVTVFVSFIVDEFGRTSNHKVVRGIDSKYDEEALEIAKKLPNDWIPGVFNGKNVASLYQIPIKFSAQ